MRCRPQTGAACCPTYYPLTEKRLFFLPNRWEEMSATYWKKRGWCFMLLSCSTRRLSLCSCSILCFCSSAPSVSPSSSSLQGGEEVGVTCRLIIKKLAPPAVQTPARQKHFAYVLLLTILPHTVWCHRLFPCLLET